MYAPQREQKQYFEKSPFAVNPFLSLLGMVSDRPGHRKDFSRPKEWALKLIRDIYDERYRVLQEVRMKATTFTNSPCPNSSDE